MQITNSIKQKKKIRTKYLDYLRDANLRNQIIIQKYGVPPLAQPPDEPSEYIEGIKVA